MSGTLSPLAWQTFFGDDGEVVSGGFLGTFVTGTDTPVDTWSNVGLTVLNDNPIQLDAAGRCVIYLANASYKYKLYDSNMVLIRTQDGIPSTAIGSLTVGSLVNYLGGDPNSPIYSTTYGAGTLFTACAAGSSQILIDSFDITGTYQLECMMLSSAGTVTAALVNLTDGSPDTPIVTCASSSTTGERQVSGVITFPAPGASKTYALKVKNSSGYGLVWNAQLSRVS